MKVNLYVLNPEGKLDSYSIDLADMVTLIDWNNHNKKIVYKQINKEGDLLVPSRVVTNKLTHTDTQMEKSFFEEFSHLYSNGDDYFVDLKDWNQRPPRKPRKQKGELVRLVLLLIIDIEDEEFSIEEGPWIYIEDREQSSRLTEDIYRERKNINRVSLESHKFDKEADFLDEIEKFMSYGRNFFVYRSLDLDDLKEILAKRPSLYKELI